MQIDQLYQLFSQYPIISIDSRSCVPDSIFFALRGEHFDGNDYIEQVLQKGAAYVVGDRKDLPKNDRIIIVDNALQALQELANYHRQRMNVKVIGITGTNGKTTTKELIAAVLSAQYPITYTQGNLNNHIGVPLTLLQIKPEHQFSIVEMGANHPGEIGELCKIANPDYGIITNIGKAHLEGFGSFEGVIKTKSELYTYLREKGGIVFGNQDDHLLRVLQLGLTVIGYGISSDAFVSGNMLKWVPALSLEWRTDNRSYQIQTHLIGRYNLENILAAVCVGVYFNVDAFDINKALSNYIPSNNRSQTIQTENNDLILDAYNANPSSMYAVLENFNALEGLPQMAILGEMKELGDYSEEEHKKLVEQLVERKFNKVFLVGRAFEHCALFLPHWKSFFSTEELIDYLKENKIKGFQILIKGSRGNQLEKIVPYL